MIVLTSVANIIFSTMAGGRETKEYLGNMSGILSDSIKRVAPHMYWHQHCML